MRPDALARGRVPIKLGMAIVVGSANIGRRFNRRYSADNGRVADPLVQADGICRASIIEARAVASGRGIGVGERRERGVHFDISL
jgi:hypothetical protein